MGGGRRYNSKAERKPPGMVSVQARPPRQKNMEDLAEQKERSFIALNLKAGLLIRTDTYSTQCTYTQVLQTQISAPWKLLQVYDAEVALPNKSSATGAVSLVKKPAITGNEVSPVTSSIEIFALA